MISFLRGRVLDSEAELLTLDVGGVGYELNCSASTMNDLFGKVEAELFVYTAVREDAITLYGFSSMLEKKLFLSLIKVNGVGPKMATKILSGASLTQLFAMIENGDVKGLSSLPKVGKKTAEQLILALRGKLVTEESASHLRTPLKRRDEIVSALVNLGFRLQDVEKIMGGIAEDSDLQQGIRQGLQALSGQF